MEEGKDSQRTYLLAVRNSLYVVVIVVAHGLNGFGFCLLFLFTCFSSFSLLNFGNPAGRTQGEHNLQLFY